ncbi:TetR/AcrR family transcriptional regulator [Burkholderia cepacia]|uniref:TetR/AcrR family transcriptional regulator n=1 Tax=Burkholderia cepacia TaxID=292 RepID=UPI001CF40D57|nr:TetR/AcrR family transcriptional regulator [Burkholderia cepacia]MCA8212610.1 TetR/AcrR family transcriptional regulator [Burkholderia cepacia]
MFQALQSSISGDYRRGLNLILRTKGKTMKISKEQARENRDRVVETAARLFRERGFDGVGVAELMRAAGFTHGGFYNHFPSKEALVVKAANFAYRHRAEQVGPDDGIETILRNYLSDEHLEDLGGSCPTAGLGSDAARQTEEVRAAFGAGIDGMIRSYDAALGDCAPLSRDARRALALNLLAKAVGAIVMARAVPASDPLAHEILSTCLTGALDELAHAMASKRDGGIG